MNEAVKIGSYEDDDYGNDCFAVEEILRMEMIAALSSKVRDGMDPHTFFNLYGDDRTLDQCT